jgi:phosphoglucosamine mutase
MRKYFGTDGVRGRVGEYPITPDFAMRLGYAVGMVLKRYDANPTVIIGKDTRLSGYLFESGLEAGFSYAGVNVYMAGPIPTPAVAYLTRALRLSAGVVISASHNQYYDNGIKFFSKTGHKLDDALELEIESLLDQEMKYTGSLGKVTRLEDAGGRYIEFCKNTFPLDSGLHGLKIALDCANGATYNVAPKVFRELGAEIVELATSPNGININNKCGSTAPQALIEEVVKKKCDLGIAFDGDGDRVLFVDASGTIYDGDKLLYIIFTLYKKIGMPIVGVVGTVMTNMGLESALRSSNVDFVRAKVGDRYVFEQLTSRGWVLGGESSGHLLCLDKHTTGDGIISALQVLAAVIKLNKPLSSFIDWQEYAQVMLSVNLSETNKDWQIKSEEIIKQANLALDNNGRVVVRASGTEPIIRVMVEASNQSLAQEWADKIARQIVTNQ